MYRTTGAPLRVNTARRSHARLPRAQRVCQQCMAGEVEDEFHFIARCARWHAQRVQLRRDLRAYVTPTALADDLFLAQLVLGQFDAAVTRPARGRPYVQPAWLTGVTVAAGGAATAVAATATAEEEQLRQHMARTAANHAIRIAARYLQRIHSARVACDS